MQCILSPQSIGTNKTHYNCTFFFIYILSWDKNSYTIFSYKENAQLNPLVLNILGKLQNIWEKEGPIKEKG